MAEIRVLHILDGLRSGGAETFIMNVYRNINRDRIQFDFLLRSKKDNVYVDEVKSLGGKVYFISPFPQKICSNLRELKMFFKQHPEYKIVHIHANSLIYSFPLTYAINNGVEKRIIHSHNTLAVNKVATLIHYLMRPYVYKIASHKFACSEVAGEWMFGNRGFKVINNSIDGEEFRYNKK